jgi:FAD/FMN-containing dehydrogenase
MDLLAGLGTVLPGDRVASGEEELKRHGGVFTYHAPVRPDAVVYPESRDEVVEILRFANEHRIPIVPFGQGSSPEAHTIPVGEHDIGAGKTAHLQKEHSDSLPLMREIKRIADPNGIMNPGKIFSGE